MTVPLCLTEKLIPADDGDATLRAMRDAMRDAREAAGRAGRVVDAIMKNQLRLCTDAARESMARQLSFQASADERQALAAAIAAAEREIAGIEARAGAGPYGPERARRGLLIKALTAGQRGQQALDFYLDNLTDRELVRAASAAAEAERAAMES